MNEPLISIGIPCYNAERYVDYAIRSIIAQSYTNWELLIIDDGSTDGTLNKLKSYQDSRIKIFLDGENKGISYRLNQLIDYAKGEYFARMDADDIMFPERLSKQLELLQADPKIDVVGSTAIVIDNSNRVLGKRGERMSSTSLKNVFAHALFIHPSVMGKMNWFRKYKYVNDLQGVEDYDLWCRSYKDSHFFLMEEPLIFYRDPLKFKLKTYLFRQRQLRKALKRNAHLLGDNFYVLRLIAQSYIKQFVASLTFFSKMDYFIVGSRNQRINNLYYQSKLDEFVNYDFWGKKPI